MLKQITNWRNYDDAYEAWKSFKRAIDEKYGVRFFLTLYPFYKIVRPLRKRFINKRKADCEDQTYRVEVHREFDKLKKTILLFTHEASQTGAPILAFSLLEKFSVRYNVISVLLGPGKLEEAFKKVSFATLGPFPHGMRWTTSIHKPILQVCRQFKPDFAIVNSIESRESLIPLYEAKVPSVQLIHEFASSVYTPHIVMRTVSYADQIVFPARIVWKDAVDSLPLFGSRSANIITQGSPRIPREWLSNGNGDEEEAKRIASVMRPQGPDDDTVVVIGLGTIDVRKGVDLFIAVAAALQRRSSPRRYRFIWVGAGNFTENLYWRFLDVQIGRSGLNDQLVFLGEVNSLDAVYGTADVFLLTSRLDPFPNVAIDAMLNGLPIVCFENASGVAEKLADNPVLKRLVVPYADAASAAAAIEQLAGDDSNFQAAQKAIRELAISTFDMDGYIDHLEKLADRASLIRTQEEKDYSTVKENCLFDITFAKPPDSASHGDYVKQFIRENARVGGIRSPFPGFHPGIYRNAHPELNEPPFVNPLAHFIRNGQPDGPWLLDLITPSRSPSPSTKIELRTVIHMHIHYPDLAFDILQPILKNANRPDLVVTVTSNEGVEKVSIAAAELAIDIKEIVTVPNRGRDIGPFLSLAGHHFFRDYEVVGHLHAKRSPSLQNGDLWRAFCFESLLGGEHPMMDIILDQFATDPKLGIVFPCDPHTIGWTKNRPAAERLLQRMGLVMELDDEFFFPIGTMFWARCDAIEPFHNLNLKWDEYPPEPVPYDGTVLHAIERLLSLVVQHRGYRISGSYAPGLTR